MALKVLMGCHRQLGLKDFFMAAAMGNKQVHITTRT